MERKVIYHRRHLEPVLGRLLSTFPVVVLTGARQTGKSTLARHLPSASGRRYLTFDDLRLLESADRNPQAFVEELETPVTLDELQRVPQLFLPIKFVVDRDRRPGRFLLTGSANLLLLKGVADSLAGRAAYLTLGSMTEREKAELEPSGFWEAAFHAGTAAELVKLAGPCREGWTWQRAALEGGFPPAALSVPPEERVQWLDDYVRSYLERDLRQLSEVGALLDFRRLMQMAALRTGQVLNQSGLARDAGIPPATLHRWLNLLEVSYQVVRLPAFFVNRTKRLIKAPKLYWSDTGLGAFLAGVSDEGAVPGAWLENLVLAQMRAWAEPLAPRPEICFWRTAAGEEVDFVLSWKRRWLPVEMKAATRVGLEDARGLEAFLGECPQEAPFGVLLYGGKEAYRLTEKIAVVPVGAVV